MKTNQLKKLFAVTIVLVAATSTALAIELRTVFFRQGADDTY